MIDLHSLILSSHRSISHVVILAQIYIVFSYSHAYQILLFKHILLIHIRIIRMAASILQLQISVSVVQKKKTKTQISECLRL